MATLTSDCTDTQLLREFAQLHSDSAFRELTQRHVNLVFGTAFRATNERSSAEEITQNVFLALARKALWLQHEGSVAAWLHRATLMETRQWWRTEQRRRTREQTAAELETTMKTTDKTEAAMGAVLDEALLALREGDRQAVLLRYFEGRNHREIGAALGIGEDAARKRVDKAMDQLLAFFRQRGFAVGSAAMLVAFLSSATHAAPANLAAAASAAALTTGSTTLPWLAKLLGMSRAKLAGLSLMVLLVPLVWQETRLLSTRAEQRRMETLLALLQSQHADLIGDLAQAQAQLNRASNSLARIERQTQPLALLAAVGITNLDARLFLWDEGAAYVRLPKSVMDWIAFDGENRRVPIGSEASNGERTINKDTGRASATLLSALGLSEEEQAQIQQCCETHVKAYQAFADSHSYVTNSLPSDLGNVPEFVKLNAASRIWIIPQMAEAGAIRRTRFEQELTALAGNERTRIILKNAWQDRSLDRCFLGFGTDPLIVVVTPLPKGECSISQHRPYQDSPVWTEMTSRLFAMLIPEHVDFLVRPMPEALKAYLQQWQTTHPGSPNN